MGSPHVDRHLSPAEAAVSRATVAGLGADVSNTNNMQELFSDVKAVSSSVRTSARPLRSLPIGSITLSSTVKPGTWSSAMTTTPSAGARSSICDQSRARPRALLQGMAREILAQGLGQPPAESSPQLADLRASLARYDLDSVSETTGILPIRSSRRPPSMRPEALVKRLTAPIRRL